MHFLYIKLDSKTWHNVDVDHLFTANELTIDRCSSEVDPVWDIMWAPVGVNSLDGQFCPNVDGEEVTGLYMYKSDAN